MVDHRSGLGGADMIVFTGGIGDDDVIVRSTICADLGWAGVSIDPVAADVRLVARVLPTFEDAEMARAVFAFGDRLNSS